MANWLSKLSYKLYIPEALVFMVKLFWANFLVNSLRNSLLQMALKCDKWQNVFNFIKPDWRQRKLDIILSILFWLLNVKSSQKTTKKPESFWRHLNSNDGSHERLFGCPCQQKIRLISRESLKQPRTRCATKASSDQTIQTKIGSDESDLGCALGLRDWLEPRTGGAIPYRLESRTGGTRTSVVHGGAIPSSFTHWEYSDWQFKILK